MREFFEQFTSIVLNVGFAYSVFRVTAPILFAAMGCAVAEKAGAPNIGMEGIMLISAFAGVIGSAFLGSVWLGLLCALIAGVAMGLFMAYFALKLRVDIILVGIAVNLIGGGGTLFFLYVLTGDRAVSSSLVSGSLPKLAIPLLDKIPILGDIFSGHNVLTYIAFLSVAAVAFLLYKTRLGLRIRAVGENSEAAGSVGVSVDRIKTVALSISGLLGGLGGAYMSMAYLSMFAKNMTAGRGFIGLAACSMGGANPVASMLTALLFGFADALSNSMRTLHVADELIIMIPYIATIIGLVVYSIRKQKKAKLKLAKVD